MGDFWQFWSSRSVPKLPKLPILKGQKFSIFSQNSTFGPPHPENLQFSFLTHLSQTTPKWNYCGWSWSPPSPSAVSGHAEIMVATAAEAAEAAVWDFASPLKI